jgi:hypothetical protein
LLRIVGRFCETPLSERRLIQTPYKFLRIIQYYLRLSFAHFKLGAHFLDLSGLLFQDGSKDFDFLLLFHGSRLLR